ncbi:MAG: NADP-dependent malic enzyme (EC [uncultured Sulfurovum sp.]|uniref:NADP-dependent malic enzyme (EC) n=1 Tax=uncultured Sulfurovum sp. TaxID=269237 RepID=A0A6S6SYG4_9BACT|nr:MAG: NADP-dependent malic enzyme (EC [uncultured Sulfurovum sp.]
MDKFKNDSLQYHINGKTATQITKPCKTQEELSMAYSPGVAYPCLEIAENPALAYKYTNKGNTVAVISNGTAVLGLGDIGGLAGKPVMEGKAVLFKSFANVDAVDVILNITDIDAIVDTCVAISDTYGGINLEDIKAPECFEIERKLQERINIPVMHDDQHGTAIITSAGLLNALELADKKIEDIKIVVIGAGAAGIASAKMYQNLGAKNIVMLDSKGVIHNKRTDLNKYKQEFAIETEDRSITDALKNADMMLGLSQGDTVSQDMIKNMAPNAIIFACANPVPEINPNKVEEVRPDIIVGTGRSDYPNQVNNVLGFPFIFRGALDSGAKKITENMKMAAAKALAALAKEPVPYYVKAAYNDPDLTYGRKHIIPTPFSREALIWVSSAVAHAAFEDGVTDMKVCDVEGYREKLRTMIYIDPQENPSVKDL